MNKDFTNQHTIPLLNTDSGYFVAFADAQVPPAPPVIHNGDLQITPSPSNEGGQVTLHGQFTDTSGTETHTVTIDWGDNSGIQTVNLAKNVYTFSPTHTYSDNLPGNAPYTIHVTVTDSTNLSGSADTQIVVNDVAPSPTITGAPTTSPEGTAISVGVNPNDPGTNDTFTYAWTVTKNGELRLRYQFHVDVHAGRQRCISRERDRHR